MLYQILTYLKQVAEVSNEVKDDEGIEEDGGERGDDLGGGEWIHFRTLTAQPLLQLQYTLNENLFLRNMKMVMTARAQR